MYGLQVSDLIGKKLSDLMPDNKTNRDYLTQFFENGGYIENAPSLEYDPQGNPKHFLNSMYAEIVNGQLLRAWGRQIDITAEATRLTDLENALRRFQSVWENSLDGLCLLEPNGRIVQANPAFCELIGKSASAVEGHLLPEFFQTPDSKLEHLIMGGQSLRANRQVHELRLWNDQIRLIEISSSTLTINDTQLILGTFHDVTEQQKNARLLTEVSQRFQWLYEYAPAGYHILNPDGTIIDVNTKWTQMLGYSKEEVIGKPIFDFVVPREREISRASFQRKIDSRAKYTLPSERIFQTKTGNEVVCLIHDYFTYNEKDQLITILTTIQDITERKRIEQELRESERQLATVISNIPGLVYRCKNDPNWTMEYLSPACKEVTGYEPEELIDNKVLSFNDLIHPDHRQRLWQKWQEILSRQEVFEDEYPIITKNGELRWVWERGCGVFDEKGNLLFLEGIITDITDRKKTADALRTERALLRTVIDNLPDAIYVKDTEGHKTLANIVDLHNLGGKTVEEVIGKDDYAFYPKEIADAFYQDDRQVLDTGQAIINREEKIHRADGTDGYLLTSKVPLRDEHGKIIGLVGIGHDITQNKLAELALRESEAKFRALAEASPAAIFIYQNNRFVYANPATEKLTGLSADELLQINFWDVVHPDFRELVKERGLARQRGEPVPTHYEFKIIGPEQEERWIDFAGALTVYAGKPAAVGFAYDVTERKRIEEELIKSRSEWETIFRAIGHPTLIIAPDHTIINANWSVLQKLGLSLENLVGKKCYEYFHGPENLPPAICPLHRVNTTLGNEVSEMYIEGLQGWYLVTCTPVFDEKGKISRVIHIMTDITERKRAEDALAESEEKFRLLVENLAEVFFQVDTENRLVYVNPAVRTVLGYEPEELIGWDYKDLIPTDNKALLAEEIAQKARGRNVFQLFDIQLIRKDSFTIEAEISAAPIFTADGTFHGYVGIARDVSERRQIEAERAKFAKLESLSILAGGIAHDFNNLLTGIMGNISLAKMKNKDEALRPTLDRAERASVRARDLTQQLLTFAKGGEPIREDTPLHDLVRESVEFICRGKPIKPQFKFAPNLPLANVDPGQVNQVIQNLILNAVQAMPDGGTLIVALEPVEVSQASAAPLKPGRYLKLKVTDTGVGIPEKIIHRIFDPYFSTKQSGSGLGLAIVHSIVKRHGGHIEVESTPGVGTTFTLYLPASTATAPMSTATAPEMSSDQSGGRILLMDDEDLVLEVGRAMLESLGYEVVTVSDGQAMLASYQAAQKEGKPFAAVIMDLTIVGGMGGKEAIAELRKIDPHARAIVSSGYSNDPIMAHPTEYGFDDVIDKPYDVDKMRTALQRVIKNKNG
jgi:PAS domain S-box-containing protein